MYFVKHCTEYQMVKQRKKGVAHWLTVVKLATRTQWIDPSYVGLMHRGPE